MEWLESRVLRSARPFVPNSGSLDFGNQAGGGTGTTEDDRAMAQMMCDLVLGEIQTEIDRVEKEAERRRQEELRLTNQPDYAWLMDWRLRAKRPLGFRESSEVEHLCAKVRPSEWRRLLNEWRTRVRYVDGREEVLGSFRTVVDQLVAERMQRECSMESVDEHAVTGGIEASAPKQPQQKPRPKTARSPRVHYQTAQLSVFTLTRPGEEGEV